MKKAMLIVICLTILLVVSSCNKSDKMSMETSCNDNSIDETKSIQEAYNNGSGQYENDNSVEDDKIKKQQITSNQNTESKDYAIENKTISKNLNDILQKQYILNDFITIYPQYEITAKSNFSINVKIPEYKDVCFVFFGDLNGNISEYRMVSANAGGDVLLPEHFGKTFDQIITEEGHKASYILSDNLMQHLYKYEDIYIYRDDFYYYIRGYRHLSKLTSEHIAMLRYDENHQRP